MTDSRGSAADVVLRALGIGVIAIVLAALSFALWIGIENVQRIGV